MQIRCSNCFQEYEADYGVCPYCGYSEGDATAEAYCLTPGTEIAGRYLIGRMLGLGGFGITYQAWDQKLETVMAVKEYYPSGLVNRLPGQAEVMLVASKREEEFRYGKERFLEEARNLARFNTHPNIVNVYVFLRPTTPPTSSWSSWTGRRSASSSSSRARPSPGSAAWSWPRTCAPL